LFLDTISTVQSVAVPAAL